MENFEDGCERVGKFLSTGVMCNNPVAGMMLYGGIELASYLNKFAQERINEKTDKMLIFLEELKNYIKEEIEDVDKVFISNQYFNEILEQILIKVSNTTTIYKKNLFKKIIKNEIKAQSKIDFSKNYLNIISELHPEEIEIIMFVKKNQTPVTMPTSENDWVEKQKLRSHLDNLEFLNQEVSLENFELYLNDLKYKGLIETAEMRGYDHLRVNILAKKLIKYIEGDEE